MIDKVETKMFVAKCGNKYLYKWSEPQFTSYAWGDTHTTFRTKEECINAAGSAMRNSEKPKAPVIIQELKRTIITEVLNEEEL